MHVSEVFQERYSYILKNISVTTNSYGSEVVECDRYTHQVPEEFVDRVKFEMFKKFKTFLTKNNITDKSELTFSYRGLQEGLNGFQYHDCFVCLKENDKFLTPAAQPCDSKKVDEFLKTAKVSGKFLTETVLKKLIDEQIAKMKGLITEETARFLVAKNLGMKI